MHTSGSFCLIGPANPAVWFLSMKKSTVLGLMNSKTPTQPFFTERKGTKEATRENGSGLMVNFRLSRHELLG